MDDRLKVGNDLGALDRPLQFDARLYLSRHYGTVGYTIRRSGTITNLGKTVHREIPARKASWKRLRCGILKGRFGVPHRERE